jgi:hypothetical protein
MQEGRDHENESPERDSAPSQPGEPTPSAGGGPQEDPTPGASWVPFSMTSPEDAPSAPAPDPGRGGGVEASGDEAGAEPAGAGSQPMGPGAPVPPPGGEPLRGQPSYPYAGYGQPGYAPPGYGPPGYAQPCCCPGPAQIGCVPG